jgi:hypothetical protein
MLPGRIGFRRQIVPACWKVPGAKLARVIDFRIVEALKLPLAIHPNRAKNIDVSVRPEVAILISNTT